jgi:hypothetical protein
MSPGWIGLDMEADPVDIRVPLRSGFLVFHVAAKSAAAVR